MRLLHQNYETDHIDRLWKTYWETLLRNIDYKIAFRTNNALVKIYNNQQHFFLVNLGFIKVYNTQNDMSSLKTNHFNLLLLPN